MARAVFASPFAARVLVVAAGGEGLAAPGLVVNAEVYAVVARHTARVGDLQIGVGRLRANLGQQALCIVLYLEIIGKIDKREFWQRAEDRTQNTANMYNKLGMAEYQAIEVFVKMR